MKMRISWKAVADNLIVHMSRNQMQTAYDRQIARLNDATDIMDSNERDAARQTARYLAECIATYDTDFE
jgi:hypothetical protein